MDNPIDPTDHLRKGWATYREAVRLLGPRADYTDGLRDLLRDSIHRRDPSKLEQHLDKLYSSIVSIPGCTLEIHRHRGVIYVHGPTGPTIMRICSLPTPIPDPWTGMGGMPQALDITHMVGTDWTGERLMMPHDPDRRKPA